MTLPRSASLALVCALLFSGGASGWEARTHAGLTEGAALAAPLQRILTEKLGLPLGLYEPLALSKRAIEDPGLRRRLAALDPAGGYAPENDRATALAWLTAGAVLEGIPAARNRNHFFDPGTRSGLEGAGVGVAFRTRAADVTQGIGTVREAFTGSSFDGSGHSAPAWVMASRALNAWGLARFLDERERAAAATTPAERQDAMARTLLAAGSILHVLEDMGDPTYLTADYRQALDDGRVRFERAVDAAYGRIAVPPPAANTLPAARLVDLFSAKDGSGLADRAARLTAGRIDPNDAARLLPEVGRYAKSAIEWLFRGELGLEASARSLTAIAHGLALGQGEISIYADDAQHTRHRLAAREIEGAREGALLVSADRPDWARHATAIFRGVDGSGAPIVIVEEQPLR